jgi:hypothetical protein
VRREKELVRSTFFSSSISCSSLSARLWRFVGGAGCCEPVW